MLTDQIFSRPIEVIIGPEIFREDNALGMNMEVVETFQRVISPAGMFRFYYLDFISSFDGDNALFCNDLRNLGVTLVPVLVPTDKPIRNEKLVSDLAKSADIVFPVKVLKTMKIRGAYEYPGSVAAFVGALSVQVQSTAAFSFSKFCEF